MGTESLHVLSEKLNRFLEHQAEIEQMFGKNQTSLYSAATNVRDVLKTHRIEFIYSGGIARSIYGRNSSTDNVDLVIHSKNIPQTNKALHEMGMIQGQALEYPNPNRMIHTWVYGDRDVRLLTFPEAEDLESAIFERANHLSDFGNVVSFEDLILLKLFSLRIKDKAHIAELMIFSKPDMDYLSKWSERFKIQSRLDFLYENHGES